MKDVIEGMAHAMAAYYDAHLAKIPPPSYWDCDSAHWRGLAQTALDYLKQPTPASKPLPEGQGPELTIEQIAAMEKLG